jgi:hypothetical protein
MSRYNDGPRTKRTTGGEPDKVDRYRRVPFFHIMEWQKPAN